MDENAISKAVLNAAFRIHTQLGPGLLESIYEAILARDLSRQGFSVVRQQGVLIRFEEMQFDEGFRLKLGLLINFNEALLKDGIKRVVNGLSD